jgi:hypothetical protein
VAARGRREGLREQCGGSGGLDAELVDVAVGVGDVAAVGPAVVLISGDTRVAFGASDLTKRLVLIEYTGHCLAGVDLQHRVGQHVSGLLRVAQHSAGELVMCGRDTVAVGVRGRAADLLSGE